MFARDLARVPDRCRLGPFRKGVHGLLTRKRWQVKSRVRVPTYLRCSTPLDLSRNTSFGLAEPVFILAEFT